MLNSASHLQDWGSFLFLAYCIVKIYRRGPECSQAASTDETLAMVDLLSNATVPPSFSDASCLNQSEAQLRIDPAGAAFVDYLDSVVL